jgi:hypothetical protein
MLTILRADPFRVLRTVPSFFLTSENAISLRTAIFRDDGRIGHLLLAPRISGDESKVCWVFRRRQSLFRRLHHLLTSYELAKLEYCIRAEAVPLKPRLEFVWSDTGLSVAVIVEEVPWAFIHETARKGYSKSVKKSILGNPWDEALYRDTFL